MSANRKRLRVLHVHRTIQPKGGGQAVAAWALMALKDWCDVTLLSWDELQYDAVNRMFGTSLKPGEFRARWMSRPTRRCLDLLPLPLEQVRLGLMMRAARRLVAAERFDAVIGTDNEGDFGRPGVQYVHYPWRRPPLKEELRPIHRVPGFVPAYQWLTTRGMGISMRRVRRNRTLVNSPFIAGKVKHYWGIESEIVPPPVPGGFPAVPWAERENGFIGIGRIHDTKRWPLAVRLVDRLRAMRPDLGDVRLTIVGSRDQPETIVALEQMQRTRPWLKVLLNLPRERMVGEIARRRYGIHMMREEHFGIAPAELLRAGCIPFVHNSGGPPWIVGGHPELLIDGEEDGAGKMEAVLESPALQQDLHARLAGRREEFTETRFMERIRLCVREMAEADLGVSA